MSDVKSIRPPNAVLPPGVRLAAGPPVPRDPVEGLFAEYKTVADVLAKIRARCASKTSSSPPVFDPDERKVLVHLFAGVGPEGTIRSGIKRSEFLVGASADNAETGAPTFFGNVVQGDNYSDRIGLGTRLLHSEVSITGFWAQSATDTSTFASPDVRVVACLDKMAFLASQQYAESGTAGNDDCTSGLFWIPTTGSTGPNLLDAQKSLITYPARYHCVHDHHISMGFAAFPTGGVAADKFDLIKACKTQKYRWDWHGAVQTYYSTSAGIFVNAPMFYVMQNSDTPVDFVYTMTIFTYFMDQTDI